MKNRNRLLTSQRTLNLALLAFAAWTGSAFAQSAPASAAAAPAPEEPRPKLTAANTANPAAPAPQQEETVVLSPFEVKSDTKGYYSSNTMSGTRFNTKLEDLGSSITVMTKEQMSDFAMVDINDVFLYTAGAEGTGTYTDYVVDRGGGVTDNVQMNPTQANRLRGISSANISYNNYEMSGRMPIDPLLIEGIEITRGPNASVFGLGNASGTVNQVATSANLFRDITRSELRADSYDGYRTTLDINRTLIKNKLAIRVNGGFQHEGFVRKPSGVNTVRYDAFVKYKPFKNTTISGSLLYYRMNGNRPNFTPPRDYVSDWVNSGKATWDPVLQEVHWNGQTFRFTSDTAVVNGRTLNSFGLSRAGGMQTRANLYVDQNGIAYWTAPNTNNMAPSSGTATPTANGQTIRLMESSVNLGTASASPGRYTGQRLWTTTPVVADKSIYDWSDINVSSVNRLMDRTLVYNAQLDQIVFETPRQMLAVQLGALREDNERYARTPLGNSGNSGQSGQLFVDVNEKNIDGTPNQFFGKTFLAAGEPLTKWSPATWDTYRAQAAYRLDLRNENGLLKWLGVQQLSVYDEYKYRVSRVYAYREAMASSPSWLSNVTTANYARANQGSVTGGPAAGPNIMRQYIRYYVGGNSNGRIDYAPSTFDYGSYPFVWGGYTVSSSLPTNAGTFIRDPLALDLLATTDGTGGTNNLKQVIKTPGAVWQTQLFDNKLVTVVGYRQDKVFSKNGVNPNLIGNNTLHDYERDSHWTAGDYRYNVGKTKTLSVVARPLRDIEAINRAAENNTGLTHWVADIARNLSFTYNKSDNFIPQPPAIDIFRNALPNVTGKGTDYGFWLPLADGKFVLRFNRWKTNQYNARDGEANVVVQRVLRKDILYSTGSVDPWNLPALIATTWNAALGSPSGAALDAKIAEITKIPTADAQALAEAFQAGTLAATNDITAKGTEIELNFNPNRYWTVAASATETESISSNMSKSIQDWIDLRMPVWTTIKDPVTGANWWTSTYGSNTPEANHAVFVTAPYSVFKEQEGKSKPSVRKYAFKLSSSLQLAALTENKILKNFKVGGAIRWEDKGAIGYYGKDYTTRLASGQEILELDANNPIWDKAHYYFDAFVGYKTKLWSNKIVTNIQLNVRNIQENGRLQPIGAFPDGTPNAYRIVDPRQFILTVTFDL